MISEIIIGGFVEAIFGHAFEYFNLGARISRGGKDPIKKDFHDAVKFAFGEFEKEYPDYANLFFDQSFLEQEAAPLLSKLLTRHRNIEGKELAMAWADSINLQGETREDEIINITPAVDFLLSLLIGKLKDSKNSDLQTIFDSRNLENIDEKIERLVRQGELNHTDKDVMNAPPPYRTRIPKSQETQFIGREDELEWLENKLMPGNCVSTGLIGMAGVGKTELALQAVNSLDADFNNRVIWISCHHKEPHEIQSQLAFAIGVDFMSNDLSIRSDKIFLKLEQSEPTLIVFDDIREQHLAVFELLRPPTPPCSFLVISRRMDLPSSIEEICEIKNPSENSLDILNNHLPGSWVDREINSAQEIVNIVGHNQLPITLVANYAQRIVNWENDQEGTPLAKTVMEMKRELMSVLDQTADLNRPDLSISAAIKLSYSDLDQKSQKCFRMLAVFANYEFELPALKVVWALDDQVFFEVITSLLNSGLLRSVDRDKWSIHSLFHEFSKKELEKNPGEYASSIYAYINYWKYLLENITLISFEDWEYFNSLRPEIENSVKYWLNADGNDLAPHVDLPILVASKLPILSIVHWEKMLLLGREHSSGSRVYQFDRYLTEYYIALHQFDKARELLLAREKPHLELMEILDPESGAELSLDEILTIYRDAINMGKSTYTLAWITGRKELALERCLETYNLLIKLSDHGILLNSEDWHQIPTLLIDLGNLLRDNGDLESSIPYFEQSINFSENNNTYRQTGVAHSDLGRVLVESGKRSEAETHFIEAIHLFDKIGDSHSSAIAKTRIADLLSDQQDYQRSEQLYRESLDIFYSLDDFIGIGFAKLSLGILFLNKGRILEAINLFTESISCYEMGGSQWNVANVKEHLAHLYGKQGNYKNAEKFYVESIAILDNIRDFQRASTVRVRLGEILRNQGRYDEAEQLFRKGLKVDGAIEHPGEIAISKKQLAGILNNKGQFDEAKTLYQECIPVMSSLGYTGHLAYAQISLAEIEWELGNHAESEELWQEGLSNYESIQQYHSLVFAMYGFAENMRKIGEFEKSNSLYSNVLNLSEDHSEPLGMALATKGLGEIAIIRGDLESGRKLLMEARNMLSDLGENKMVQEIDSKLESEVGYSIMNTFFTALNAALKGDTIAGQLAWEMTKPMVAVPENDTKKLGYALQKILAGVPAEKALQDLPGALQKYVIENIEANK